jgi:hypothetical protein
MPTATYIPLATTTVAIAAASITFGSIPATYRDLILVFDGVVSLGGGEVVQVSFNGDTTAANYPVTYADGDGSGRSSGLDTTNRRFALIYPARTNFISHIMDYSTTDKHKTFLNRINGPSNVVAINAGRWANTAAITSITIATGANAFGATSTVSLYGVIS